MSKEIIVFTGLAIGEETKGSSAQWAAAEKKAHTIWRSGGSQAGHHIVTADGREQMFSHFGAGTFEGVQTYLKHIVINSVDLFTEGLELESKGVKDPFSMIAISSDCLATTPYHGAISRFHEMLRGKNKKGTIGKGVGEALEDAENPNLAIYAGDFKKNRDLLLKKVEAIRIHNLQKAQKLLEEFKVTELPKEAQAEFELFYDTNLGEATVDSFMYLADLVQIVDDDYLDELLARDGTIVVEPSHGALLHPRFGFAPHVTQIDPTASDVLQTLKDRNYTGDIKRIGVSRCYMTRHGAGPMVSQSEEMTREIQETHNAADAKTNEWLGEFHNGYYDVVALQYALEISGGRDTFTGLKISYLDVLNRFSEWHVCEAYRYEGEAANLDEYFDHDGDKIVGIKKHPDIDSDKHYQHQLCLTELLKQCKPVLIILRPTEDRTLEQVFLKYVEDKLQLPVVAVAHGPKKEDRKFTQNYIL